MFVEESYIYASPYSNPAATVPYVLLVMLVNGAHPNQMKQMKMILKAEDAYIMIHTSAVCLPTRR